MNQVINIGPKIKEKEKRTNEEEIMILVVVGHDIKHAKSGQGVANQEQHQGKTLNDWEVFTHKTFRK